MTSAQKLVAIAGLLAIAATTCFAPHTYVARDTLAELKGEGEGPIYGTVYRSMWSEPDAKQLRFDLPKTAERPNLLDVQLVQLNTGKLGLWWGLIAAVTIVAVVLAAPGRPASLSALAPPDSPRVTP